MHRTTAVGLVTQVLAELVRCHLGLAPEDPDQANEVDVQDASGLESFDRLVLVDQRPIGRTPRSNLATYTGMFEERAGCMPRRTRRRPAA